MRDDKPIQYPRNDPRNPLNSQTHLHGDDERTEDNDMDEDWDNDDDDDDLDNAFDECGQMRGGGCTLIGTEHCDWECPFHRSVFTPRDGNGRFIKTK